MIWSVYKNKVHLGYVISPNSKEAYQKAKEKYLKATSNSTFQVVKENNNVYHDMTKEDLGDYLSLILKVPASWSRLSKEDLEMLCHSVDALVIMGSAG